MAGSGRFFSEYEEEQMRRKMARLSQQQDSAGPLFLLAASLLFLTASAAGATEAYSGRLEAKIHTTTNMIPLRRYGEATARFEPLPEGGTRFVLTGTIERENDAGFSVVGRQGPEGFRSDGPIALLIDRQGQITGGGTEGDQSYRFSGRITEEAFELRVENRPAPGAEASPVTGIDFTYSLTNDLAQPEGGTCREIRYEMRPLANLGDGTMSMISVPVCIE
jgi:hypothetical protein